jgi:Poly(ADP-ribose) polymerase and DNA-Ligase Zn-finger region
MDVAKAYAVEQVVWVQTGDKHEEPGTIVQIGQEGSDAGPGLGEVLVRLHVSAYKLVCDASMLRPLEDTTQDSSQRPRSSRRNNPNVERSVITPSPKYLANDKKVDLDSKPAPKRKQKEELASSLIVGEGKDRDVKSPLLKKVKLDDFASVSILAAPAKANVAKPKKVQQPSVLCVPCNNGSESDSESDSQDLPGDDNAADDRPFQVDYASSQRSTCRRCNESILKGSVRVSNVPLFRGKPGYRVYRHLECAVFSEEIEQAEDVGGWKKLRKDDYEALVIRVEESKLEIQKENEEIEPDELIQKAFEGEIRDAPNMVVPLLPFQVEGHSWMYHQEMHTDPRGGILADEMGMVSLSITEMYVAW